MRQFLFYLLSYLFCFSANAQTIFSSHEWEYRKPLAPYQQKRVVPLEYQEMIFLLEEGKGRFRLVRYDRYFFDKWSVSIDYGNEGSFPQLFKIGDEIVVFRLWSQKETLNAEVAVFDVNTGSQKDHRRQILNEKAVTDNFRVAYSDDRSAFIVYNVTSTENPEHLFRVYDLKTLDLLRSLPLEKEKIANKAVSVMLNNSGELFVATADPQFFQVNTYFFDNHRDVAVELSGNFTFKRPAGDIRDVKIVAQSPTTYLVMTPAYLEDELVGMNVSSFNVVLKAVLFSNTYDFDLDFIKSAYLQSLINSENQKKKHITTPRSLKNFRLQEIIPDSEGGVTCIFEYLELASTYHDPGKNVNLPLHWKTPEDRYYFGEDVMLLNFSATGLVSWKKVIQKTQYGHRNGHTLSYFSEYSDDELKITMKESSKGNSLYTYTLDLEDGGVIEAVSFLDKKVDIIKNYSNWVDEKTLLICVQNEDSNKRVFHLVEF